MNFEDLNRLLVLDRSTGRIFWRARDAADFKAGRYSAERNCKIWNARYAGSEAMTAVSRGYRVGHLGGAVWPAHRVVFALANGRMPSEQVDHIDGDRSNNHPENLREVSNQQNAWNAAPRRSASRFKGVSWHKAAQKWTAQAVLSGKKSHLGTFDHEEDAARAYDGFAVANYGPFAKLNFSVSA